MSYRPHRFEKGNWYVYETDEWGEWAIFKEGIEKPIAVTRDESLAAFLTEKLNDEEAGESWKNE